MKKEWLSLKKSHYEWLASNMYDYYSNYNITNYLFKTLKKKYDTKETGEKNERSVEV